jgi:methenyltetrahydromethanopterin cyclohydrolase
LVTPVAGLEDTYLDVTADALGMTWKAVYHEFNSDKGNIDYGNEVDVMVSKAFGKHYVLGVKYATYDADAFSVDTDKFWLWGELKF